MNKIENWKWFLISMVLFLALLAITGKLDVLTAAFVSGGFIVASAISYYKDQQQFK